MAAAYLETSWHANVAALADALAAMDERGRLQVDDARIAADQLVWLAAGPSLNELSITGDHDHASASMRIESAVVTFLARYGR